MHRLAELSAEYNAVWIDQLCMPQKDDTIRAAQAKVSRIYSTLDVTVIFPGSLCRCLRQELEAHEQKARLKQVGAKCG